MKTRSLFTAPPCLRIAMLALWLILLAAAPTMAQVAVRGETIYTMAGPAVKNGVVIIRDGKIAEVGPAASIKIPSGFKTLSARVVTPGLIDARSVVGLSGYLNQPQDQSQLERSSPIQPELRAIDAYDAQEKLVEWLREHGITTIHTGHAPGALVSGQTMIVKTHGKTVDQATLVQTAMIAVTLGRAGLGQDNKPPGTPSKMVAMLRAELLKAKDYEAKRASAAEDRRPARDLRMETLVRALKGELPLLVNAHRATDIITALRLAKEFNLKIVLDGASEAYLVVDQIKAANVPVILHPTMYRAVGETENLSLETAATLRRAGVPVALQGGYETYVPKTRVVLFEAAIAAANGLSLEEALGLVTIDAARILGIAGRVGSLEAGKDADLALFDGDPFEYTSHVTGVIIDGQVVSQTVR
jgi:imidazolonepropionase-like amidohydrolase